MMLPMVEEVGGLSAPFLLLEAVASAVDQAVYPSNVLPTSLRKAYREPRGDWPAHCWDTARPHRPWSRGARRQTLTALVVLSPQDHS